MTDVTEATTQVGQMLYQALQDVFTLGPEAALQRAMSDHGVDEATLESADMGRVLDDMCQRPDLSPEMQSYLDTVNSNYSNVGNVNQGGSTYSGGGGGGGAAASTASNQQIVQQVTQNYNYQEINDNSIDILGPVAGDIDIDQDNDDVDVTGDGNAVNTGDGDQNAATGDGSSAAQSDGGDAQSNSGDGAVQGGLIVGPTNTGTFTGNQTLGGSVENSPVGDGNIVLDNEGGNISDSGFGFGSGSVQGDVYLEEGAANAVGGDATGQSVDTNVQSDVNEEHGDGHNFEADLGGGLVRQPLSEGSERELLDVRDEGNNYPEDNGDDFSGNLSPVVEVNVEGGEGDQVESADDEIVHS